MKQLFNILIFLSFLGCNVKNLISDKNYRVKGIELKGDKRIVYLKYDATNKKAYSLSEPPPDAILERTTKLANSLAVENKTSNTNLNTDQKLELASKVVTLGERTVAVNVLRDALFRLSELNINNENKKLEDGYKILFDSILSTAKKIALADLKNAEAKKIDAEFKLKSLDQSLDAKTNYQIGIKNLIDKNVESSKVIFKELYEKYPRYFNIDEINKKLDELSKNGINEDEWKKLYRFILDGKTWRIDENLIRQIQDQIK